MFKGHLLVVPRAHVVTLPDCRRRRSRPLFVAVQRSRDAVVAGLGDGRVRGRAEQRREPGGPARARARRAPHEGDGLRGFFWPRQKYAGDDEMADYADRLAASRLT